MEIILIVLSLAVVVLSVILFIRKPNAEIDARLAQLQAMHEKEMDMREKFHTEQRMRDTENWQRQLQAVNAQAESRFRELTAQLMQQGTKELSRNNVEQLGTLLNPLQARIAEFRKAVEDSAVEDKASRKSFQSKIEELQRLNVSLGQEAEKLASALKGQNKVQGDWGEMVLRTLLEQGG